MKTILLICVVSFSVILMSCSSSDNTAKVTKTPLKKTGWTLYQLNGKSVKTNKAVTLNLSSSDNHAHGNAPCNNFTGAYTLSGKNLSFGPMAVTEIMCGDMETEDIFLKSLGNTATYKISGSELNLYDSNGNLLMIFTSK